MRKKISNLAGLKRLNKLDIQSEMFSISNFWAVILMVFGLFIGDLSENFNVLLDTNYQGISVFLAQQTLFLKLVIILIILGIIIIVSLGPTILVLSLVLYITKGWGKNKKTSMIVNIALEELIDEYEKQEKNKAMK